jgi:hypothetical protein
MASDTAHLPEHLYVCASSRRIVSDESLTALGVPAHELRDPFAG